MSQPFTRGPDDILSLLENAASFRQEWLRRMTERKAEIYKECGLPTGRISREDYYALYDRNPIAARSVEVLPRECWKVIPEVYEDDDPDTMTAFEGAWEDLPTLLSPTESHFETKPEDGGTVWEYLRRLDEQCGIGQFGVLLLGIDDGRPLWEPVEGVEIEGSVSGPENPKAKDKAREGDEQGGYQWGYGAWDGTGKAPRKPYKMQLNGAKFGREFVQNLAPPKPGAGAPPVGPRKVVVPREAAEPTSPPEKPKWESKTPLRYMRVFPEIIVDITRFEANRSSPRFGQPVEYLLTLNDPRFGDSYSGIGLTTATVRVHWTRVLHVADNVQACEWAGVPRMQQIYNNLVGLDKLFCGSPEMYWRGAFPGISFETHPQLGGDVVIDKTKLKEDVQQYFQGLQRYLTLMGMSAKTLAPQVVDPTPQINAQIQAVCVRLACPQRIFMGSERGELASGQDDSNWNGRLTERHKSFCTPKIVIPFVDRCIALGVLPPPAEGSSLKCRWPALGSMGKDQKAAVAAQVTTAMSTYVAGGVDALMEPVDYLTKVLEFTDEEARGIVERAAGHAEDQQAQQMEDQQMLIDEGLAPDPVDMAKQELEIKKQQANKPPAGLAKGAKPVVNYDPSQPRDDDGRWRHGGVGAVQVGLKGASGEIDPTTVPKREHLEMTRKAVNEAVSLLKSKGVDVSGIMDKVVVFADDTVGYHGLAQGNGLKLNVTDKILTELQSTHADSRKSYDSGEVGTFAMHDLTDSVLHEIGHNLHRKLSDKDFKEFEKVFSRTENNTDHMPSFYSQENSSEAFAESVVALARGRRFGGTGSNYGPLNPELRDFVASRVGFGLTTNADRGTSFDPLGGIMWEEAHAAQPATA